MKKYIILIITCFLLGACSSQNKLVKYEKSFLSFDTYISVVLYVEDEKTFLDYFKFVEEEMNRYHQLFDRFNNYEGINNVKSINDQAGIEKVIVDEELFQVIKDSAALYTLTFEKNNINFGSVIDLYQQQYDLENQGEKAQLPSYEALQKASLFTNINDIILDDKDFSVYLKQKENV
ncbi:MAG: FAD:protein FMN transferase, partial [Bacilli bacterium]